MAGDGDEISRLCGMSWDQANSMLSVTVKERHVRLHAEPQHANTRQTARESCQAGLHTNRPFDHVAATGGGGLKDPL